MQDTFARATHSAYAAARPSARATIGYLVYKLETIIDLYNDIKFLMKLSAIKLIKYNGAT